MPILQFNKNQDLKDLAWSGLRAEEFGDRIFLDHGLAKIGDKHLRVLVWMVQHLI